MMEGRQFLAAFEQEFSRTKSMSEASIAQVSDEDLHRRINPQQNSISVVMQHVAGNLLSRFTDFLTSDGEKPNRDRESEFADHQLSRAQLMDIWERGWTCLFAALAPLNDEDLGRTVFIRNEPHTILKALVRASAHCAWHASQIALIAKHFTGADWKYLTIPPGGSNAFNQARGVKSASATGR